MLRDSFLESARESALADERSSETVWSHCRAQIGLTRRRIYFCGHTKIVDTDSMILYDSVRKDSDFLWIGYVCKITVTRAESLAPGNRTPLVKVVLVKLLVPYLIFHLSRTHSERF